MEIVLTNINISKAGLLTLGETELHFLLLITGLSNEISMLQRLALYSANSAPADQGIESNALMLQVLFLHKLIAAKLHEGNELLRRIYYGARISEKYQNIRSLNELAKPIKAYFSKDNNISKIRHTYASHHYDVNKSLMQYFNKLPNDYIYSIFSSGQTANTIFFSSQAIEVGTILELYGQHVTHDGIRRAVFKLRDEVLDLAEMFFAFVSAYTTECVINRLSSEQGQDTSKYLTSMLFKIDATALKTIHLPFFSYCTADDIREAEEHLKHEDNDKQH